VKFSDIKFYEKLSKTLFIIPTGAHCYKSVEMLKQFKGITLASTCFGSHRNHHQGAVLFLAKTTAIIFSVVVDVDAVNAVAAYRPVVQACGQRLSELMPDLHSLVTPSAHRSPTACCC
jgi:hypothetical protein